MAPDSLSAARGAFDVVGIGASLGGLAALQAIVSHVPADFPAAIIIAHHRGPPSTSTLPVGLHTLLRRQCAMRVEEARAGAPVVAGTIYTAPGGTDLSLDGDGIIELTHAQPAPYGRPSVDVLFASLSVTYGARAIGIVLTGSLCDGARGVRAIKARRGRVLVQEPSTSVAFGMPNAAIATGCVDFVLPLASLAAALVTLVAVPGAEALFEVPLPTS